MRRASFGVRSAMPPVTARRKCPDLIFVEPRFDVYKKVSLQIRAIFAEHTAVIEPLSLDEAYLDVTENLQGIASAPEVAERIKAKIRAETQLTASAGVSYNKFFAKLASDHRKPDGLFVITPEMGPRFIEALAVERFHGVGPATAAKMKKLGIFDARDLRAKDEAFLLRYFGKAGRRAPAIWVRNSNGTNGRVGVQNSSLSKLLRWDWNLEKSIAFAVIESSLMTAPAFIYTSEPWAALSFGRPIFAPAFMRG